MSFEYSNFSQKYFLRTLSKRRKEIYVGVVRCFPSKTMSYLNISVSWKALQTFLQARTRTAYHICN